MQRTFEALPSDKLDRVHNLLSRGLFIGFSLSVNFRIALSLFRLGLGLFQHRLETRLEWTLRFVRPIRLVHSCLERTAKGLTSRRVFLFSGNRICSSSPESLRRSMRFTKFFPLDIWTVAACLICGGNARRSASSILSSRNPYDTQKTSCGESKLSHRLFWTRMQTACSLRGDDNGIFENVF